MNSSKFCLNCGSSELVSDRSLGGRIVCSKCGSSKFRNKSLSRKVNQKFLFVVIFLLILLLVLI